MFNTDFGKFCMQVCAVGALTFGLIGLGAGYLIWG